MSGTSRFWSRSRREKILGTGSVEKKILGPGGLCPFSLVSSNLSHARVTDTWPCPYHYI